MAEVQDARRAQLKWLEANAFGATEPPQETTHAHGSSTSAVGKPSADVQPRRSSVPCMALTAGLVVACIALFFATRTRTEGPATVATSTTTSPSSNTAPRAPTAIASSGGGFRAMTASMSVARALAIDDHWDKITHMSSVSGGTWFSAQMAYSDWFYRNVMDPQVGLEEVVREWGERYASALPETGTVSLVRDMLADARAGRSQQACPTGTNVSIDAYLSIAVAALLDLSVSRRPTSDPSLHTSEPL